jgi:hypothetical protein
MKMRCRFLIKLTIDAIKANKEAANQEQEENNKEIPAPAAEASPVKSAAEQQPVAAQSHVDAAPTLSANVTGDFCKSLEPQKIK